MVQEGDRLDRLSETHLIGQDAVLPGIPLLLAVPKLCSPLVPAEAEPVDSLELVIPQFVVVLPHLVRVHVLEFGFVRTGFLFLKQIRSVHICSYKPTNLHLSMTCRFFQISTFSGHSFSASSSGS